MTACGELCPNLEPHGVHEWYGKPAALRMQCPGRDYVVAGTGSRSLQTAPSEVKLRSARLVTDAVAERQREHGDRLVVMSGMAEGFDKLLALAAIRLNVRLWAAVPNRGYGAHYWGRNSLTGTDRLCEFEEILSRAWRVDYVANGLYLNGRHANFVRNLWMVDTAHEFLVWDPTSKGTAHCLAAIRRAGKPYTILSDQDAQLPLAG